MQKIKKNSWLAQELELLSTLHPQFTSKRWKRIAEQFKKRGFERTEIECREKWINFLDPAINRRQWEQWELKKLYEVHERVGTRWCVVQKFIGRTQNKIKNRFYGTLRNFIRCVLSHFGDPQACFNTQISRLSPNFLNSLYNSTSQFQFFGSQTKDAIYSMLFKIDKQILTSRIQEKKELYKRLYQSFLQQFNQSTPSPLSQEQEEQQQISQDQAKNMPDGSVLVPSKVNQFEQQTFPQAVWDSMMGYHYPQTMYLWFA